MTDVQECPHPKPCMNPFCFVSDYHIMEMFRDDCWEKYLAGDKSYYRTYLDAKSALENWNEKG